MKLRSVIAALVVASPVTFASLASAAEVPPAGMQDSRIRHVQYDRDQVFHILTNRGVSTLIVLDADESILEAGTGFNSNCKGASKSPDADAAPEWCVVANKGSNRVWVKPNEHATFNNLELVTNKRIYSFEFTARVAPKRAADSSMYRVVFDYPKPLSANGMPSPEEVVAARVHDSRPVVSNWNYTMQAMDGGEAIAPTEAFDDKRLTYFLLPGNREMPSVYVIGADGSERMVDSNVDPATGYVVVHETAKRFVLRLGKAVVGIWNESELAELPATNDGTTIQGVRRVLK